MQPTIAKATPLAQSRPWPRVASHHLLLAGVVVGALLIYIHTTLRYGQAVSMVDGHLYYVHAHSWYFDGDCDYTNDLRADPTLAARDAYLLLRSPTGRLMNFFPCGWSVAALPFVALADGLTAAHNLVSAVSLPRDGYSVYYRFVVPLGHVLLALFGMLAGYAVTARYFPKLIAAAATALVWAGTCVIYFVSVEPTVAHAASLGFVTGLVWIADTIRLRGWSTIRAVGLGLCCGMMTATRHQNVVWVVFPLVLIGPELASGLIRRRSGAGRAACHAALSVAVAAMCLVPQVGVNLVVLGTVGSNLQRFAPDWLHPQLLRELLQPAGGLMPLYPLVAVSLVGLMYWLHRRRDLRMVLALLTAFTVMWYMNACGAMAASRRYTCCFIIFVFGLAAVLQWSAQRRWRAVLTGSIVAGACLRNLGMLWLVDRGYIDRLVFTAVLAEPPQILEQMARWLAMGGTS